MRSPKNLIALNLYSVQSLEEDGVSEACSSSRSVHPDLLERRCYGGDRSVETSARSIEQNRERVLLFILQLKKLKRCRHPRQGQLTNVE